MEDTDPEGGWSVLFGPWYSQPGLDKLHPHLPTYHAALQVGNTTQRVILM